MTQARVTPILSLRHFARRARGYWYDTVTRIFWRMHTKQLARSFKRTASPQIFGTMLQNPHAEAILRDFHWLEYMRANQDLHFDNEQEARRHLVYNGYHERRLIDLDRNSRLDPAYYRRRYPELALANDADAQVHYTYAGFYEERFANADTEWLCNATLHVFQPGKVGSYAIAEALNGRYDGGVLHLHWPTDLALHYPACSLTYPEILAHPRAQPLRVISGGRELVLRVLSGACHHLGSLAVNASGRVDKERLSAYLEDAFRSDCAVIANWFDHQFHCGLDIYAHQFDRERGYIRIGNETVDLFLYRQEDLARIESSLADFLAMPNFKLRRINAAPDKPYARAYQELMANFVVPRATLQELYATRYMQFFFTDEERTALIEYWSKPRLQ